MVDVDNARSVLQTSAEDYENDQTLEAMWAMKAFEHAEIYFNILSSVDPKLLRLTPMDDTIYSLFRSEFPKLKIDVIDEEEMKSAQGKVKWRGFCEKFKDVIEDYSFGTLLRVNCAEDYTEKNSMFTTRIQFFAIELARNKEGFNDNIRTKFRNIKKDDFKDLP